MRFGDTRGLRASSVLAATALAISLAGCASSTDSAKLLNPDPPDKTYAVGDALLAKGRFEEAAKKFEDLDRDHPYAGESKRASVLAAYAYYRAGKFPEAIATARRFTQLHPGTKDAPFAHHIIAMSYFEEMRGPKNDQSSTRKALAEFKILKARYPDSKYATEADNRIRVAEDSIAANEMEVGRFYQKRGNHTAAINRFKSVVTEHQNTQHVEEALMRLVECYMSLGIKEEAQTAAAVLGHNFPNSQWYKDAYVLLQSDGLAPREDTGSWLSQSWKNFKLPKLSLGG